MKRSEYHQRLRISRARELLEFSRSSVDEIATAIGYEDVRGFRRVFHNIVGLSPSDYRRRFSRIKPRAVEIDTEPRRSSLKGNDSRSIC